MVSLTGIISTVKTTSNFWAAIMMRRSGERKQIVFRNGSKITLDWTEYTTVRDIITKGYQVESYEDLLLFRKGNVKIVGPLPLVAVLLEDLNEIYSIDCKGKIVLDIGGFIGETSVFFSIRGASKLITYEPVLSHHRYIKLNLELNHVNAEIHGEGLGEADGQATIYYENTDEGFGLDNKGTKQMTIKIKSPSRILEESAADIAKIDCEGAEKDLLNVPDEVIRKISHYIIEVHTLEIKGAIITKFQKAGFTLTKDLPNVTNNEVSMVFLQRN